MTTCTKHSLATAAILSVTHRMSTFVGDENNHPLKFAIMYVMV